MGKSVGKNALIVWVKINTFVGNIFKILEPKLSQLAETLIGSEIVKLGADIRIRLAKGEKIHNYTVGDFDPKIFPIPETLKDEIISAYQKGYTNYPTAEGNIDLREALSHYASEFFGLEYTAQQILVASGGRPLIYSLFHILCDKEDGVLYGIPSWNNNHYTHFVGGKHMVIEALAQNNFMLTAEQIEPFLKEATLLSLCSPQNPTGTTFSKRVLSDICDLVIHENRRRPDGQKKLYVMYDQMYALLTHGATEHYHPVQLRSEMKDYTIYIDAISKSFASTGVRVGWALGPEHVIAKMKAMLTHVGAWAPMAEQKAVTNFLNQTQKIKDYLGHFKQELEMRLHEIYSGIMQLKEAGFKVDAIKPEAAIYLTLKFELIGHKTPENKVLSTQAEVTAFLLNYAGLAIVPFEAFGSPAHSPWYRLSVGTCNSSDIEKMLSRLGTALQELN